MPVSYLIVLPEDVFAIRTMKRFSIKRKTHLHGFKRIWYMESIVNIELSISNEVYLIERFFFVHRNHHRT